MAIYARNLWALAASIIAFLGCVLAGCVVAGIIGDTTHSDFLGSCGPYGSHTALVAMFWTYVGSLITGLALAPICFIRVRRRLARCKTNSEQIDAANGPQAGRR